jgi:hypothetical protein
VGFLTVAVGLFALLLAASKVRRVRAVDDNLDTIDPTVLGRTPFRSNSYCYPSYCDKGDKMTSRLVGGDRLHSRRGPK